ncbi:hypothetical protein N9L47_13245 [Rhodobacteraceae bacterium]|nr:hypothetical protein [Paracoccaceae bacterium]
MTLRRIFKTTATLGASALIALCAGAASAQLKPVDSPNGSVSGTIDGHTFDLPVRCLQLSSLMLDISSHNETILNLASLGGSEPGVGLLVVETGFQIVAFVGGERYKIMRATDKIEAFPYTLAREVRASKLGKVDVDFTVDCPEF